MIDQLAASALMQGRPFKQGKTSVLALPSGTCLVLYDTTIALKKPNCLLVTVGNWNTATTRNRLNAIPGVLVRKEKGKLYLNGKLWERPENLTRVY